MRGSLETIKDRVGTLLGRPRRWRWLEQLPKGGVGAEIGVFSGDLSPHLHDVGRPREFHLIDCWWTRWGEFYPDWGEARSTKISTRELHARAVERMRGRLCTFHVGDDIEILSQFPDAYFDWVYFDSDHTYEHVRDVLQVLKDKMKPDGVIVGDDWEPDPSHGNHGESVAVREFCERHAWTLESVDPVFGQWTIRPGQ
jgi:SAM-dependent methyltransferase